MLRFIYDDLVFLCLVKLYFCSCFFYPFQFLHLGVDYDRKNNVFWSLCYIWTSLNSGFLSSFVAICECMFDPMNSQFSLFGA